MKRMRVILTRPLTCGFMGIYIRHFTDFSADLRPRRSLPRKSDVRVMYEIAVLHHLHQCNVLCLYLIARHRRRKFFDEPQSLLLTTKGLGLSVIFTRRPDQRGTFAAGNGNRITALVHKRNQLIQSVSRHYWSHGSHFTPNVIFRSKTNVRILYIGTSLPQRS